MKKYFFLIVIFFLSLTNSFALEKPTHKYLNEEFIVKNSFLDNFLKQNLKIENGVRENFNNKEIIRWIGDGGIYEDEPMYTRSLNHFHDPLKSWDAAGFKGVGASSIVWAQYPLQSQIINGNYSWFDARYYFYNALIAPSDDSRGIYYSLCFRGLGQLMHLMEDASVPSMIFINFLIMKHGFFMNKIITGRISIVW
jgi:hypothetical protein